MGMISNPYNESEFFSEESHRDEIISWTSLIPAWVATTLKLKIYRHIPIGVF